MKEQTKSGAASKLGLFCFGALVVGILMFLSFPNTRANISRSELAEALNNVRQVKYALDGFAADHNGSYPDKSIAVAGINPGEMSSSNDYFRCLFLTGETESERIFWTKGSLVARKSAPDDRIRENGKLRPDLILQPGDCHWAYLTGQTTTSNIGRPLVMDSFDPNTGTWDPEHWDRKAIVLRVDGSAKALRMRISDNLILDGSNQDILSGQADAWVPGQGDLEILDPRALLVQPARRSR